MLRSQKVVQKNADGFAQQTTRESWDVEVDGDRLGGRVAATLRA
jgi:hypothetical protein